MPDPKYTRPTSILIPPDLKAELEAEAEAESRSLSGQVVHILKLHVAARAEWPASAAYQRAISTSKRKR